MKRYLLLLCLTLAVAIQASPDNAEKSQVPLADPYILLDGDTYYAFKAAAEAERPVTFGFDYEALVGYLVEGCGHEVPAQYEGPQGRITITGLE